MQVAAEPVFSWPTRVYWEDTDAGGVVYHAQYLAFLERARTEWLRARGKGQELMRIEHDLVFAVRAMRIEFRQPARLDDALDVTVALRQCRRASLVIAQSIRRGAGAAARCRGAGRRAERIGLPPAGDPVAAVRRAEINRDRHHRAERHCAGRHGEPGMIPLLAALQATAVEPLPEDAVASTAQAAATAAPAAAHNGLDVLQLVLHASIPVQLVLLLLLFASRSRRG